MFLIVFVFEFDLSVFCDDHVEEYFVEKTPILSLEEDAYTNINGGEYKN